MFGSGMVWEALFLERGDDAAAASAERFGHMYFIFGGHNGHWLQPRMGVDGWICVV